MPSPPILRIAIPGPIRTLFDYYPPDDSPQHLPPGIRLKAPFGRGSRFGVLIETCSNSQLSNKRIKQIEILIDQTPLFCQKDMAFLKWAADYYNHPLGDVIFHALPSRLRKGHDPTNNKLKSWRLTPAGTSIDPAQLKRSPRQSALISMLRAHPEGLQQTRLYTLYGECGSVLRRLRQKQWVETCMTESTPEAVAQPVPPPTLSNAQQQAVTRISAQLHGFRAILLDGVTGSGKTEVYLSLIQQLIRTSDQVLVLVPEIGLTPQLVARFQRRLGIPITLLHSGLSDGERERAWMAAQSGRAQVVVGTRSAIFTPMPRLGLIVVDEEHDLSFKQQEGFRYSARDLAVVRARRNNCPILLGSATPSLESLQNAHLDRYQLIQLKDRVGKAQLPKMDLIDICSSRLDGGLSPTLLKRVKASLQAGGQVMLFLNRRGFAPVLTCHACGWLSDCRRCDARMTLHLKNHLLWCHHCGHQQKVPPACPSCGSPDLRALGQGTERLESVLRSHFPQTPIARIDRDSTRRKGSLEKLLSGIKAGDYSLLIGTQMLAKGHHFPKVTLVGLIDVDQGLFGADYRAAERMAQLIIQVAGRAGRAEHPGHVLIQTRHPDHDLLQTLIHRGYGAFAIEALAERRLAGLPPFSHQALLRAESTRDDDPVTFLQAAAEAGRQLKDAAPLEFWGPVPAPMERRAGKIRAHLLIQSSDRGALQHWLTAWVSALEGLPSSRKVRWSLDVDPQEML